ncbi:ZYRO0B08184p [Zygosaccharomyces rouxii]|uniref:ZYRO0B08184p n=1 Tax=Zygosaccharomyces rouxii (strain ATCC 2623 / CBS 732 / NBRC 1130 / NCYC 568 / NRRL Y-229) TaxID=559307 RepID=C5DRG1_ZYGRC|nr:uncharacterized protein ZYRO0B08184g [Zygosaccharomyces rouxii]KAH9200088.1 hypothetical protein LQ764DRAFT_112110 [Zygosaccharomyces rouxii]CAR26372.1 ZYRO0B08184p [Zygosaccharomyces rouxii]
MSACQANPLTQFVTKGEQHPGFIHRFSHENSNQHQLHINAPEGVFLYGQDVAAGNRFMGGIHQGPAPITTAVPVVPPVQQQQQLHHQQVQREQQALHQSSGNGSWLSQFHSMKIEDPLEFSQDYKKMYSSYEKSTAPMVRFPMTTYQPNYNMISRDVTKREVPGEKQDAFAAEFNALEKELEDVEKKRPIFDQEQEEFQKLANEIVDSCSTSPSTKLRSSKFMGLMKGIGEGSVTLNKQKSKHATELHSPYTEQRVGNEYFPVKDSTLHYE